WVPAKTLKLRAQWALPTARGLWSVPGLPDLAKPDSGQAALRLVLARLDIGRPFFLPPGVPGERLAALRQAFDATMKDPAYPEEAKKLSIDVDPLTGAELAALVEQIAKTPSETVARVRAALESR